MPAPTSPGLRAGDQLDYVERSTTLTVSATTAAAADTFIDGNAVYYDGNLRIKVEFFCPYMEGNASVSVDLWDGSTDLGVIAQSNLSPGNASYGIMFLTPAVGSHTFHLKAWRGATSGSLFPGAGGAGTRIAAFLRITVA
jgi:hypothetical protein